MLLLLVITLPLIANTAFATKDTINTTPVDFSQINTNILVSLAILDAIGNEESHFGDVQGASDEASLVQLGYGDCIILV